VGALGRTTRVLVLAAYAAAMAFVEAAVVLYLRLLYPSAEVTGMLPFPPLVYRTEVGREVATIVMLLAVAWLAFDRLRPRILAFLWIFAIWDLGYYAFLKLLIGWPPTLRTVDVLFLIPVPWVAPVWVPLAVWSVALIASGWLLLTSAEESR
jgi:hypothetical protein